MNLNNFTIKAQELIQAAQQLAFNHQSPSIETAHLLKAMLEDKDAPISYLLKKNNIILPSLQAKLDQELARLPKLTSGDPATTISKDLNTIILKAGSLMKEFNDEFITVELLLLALLSIKDATSSILKDQGLTANGLTLAIKAPTQGAKSPLIPIFID